MSDRQQCAQNGQFMFEGHSYFIYTYGNPGVSCETVRRVVRRFLNGDTVRSGWYCRKVSDDFRGAMGDCNKGGKVMSKKGNLRWKHYIEFYGDDTEGRR